MLVFKFFLNYVWCMIFNFCYFYVLGMLGTSSHLILYLQGTLVYKIFKGEVWISFNEKIMEHVPNITTHKRRTVYVVIEVHKKKYDLYFDLKIGALP